MNKEKDILILAIESSCDETAASVVKNGRTILSNVISSQIELHKLYGGVVPEIASRKHIEKINQVIEEALTQAAFFSIYSSYLQLLSARLYPNMKGLTSIRNCDSFLSIPIDISL